MKRIKKEKKNDAQNAIALLFSWRLHLLNYLEFCLIYDDILYFIFV